MFGLFAFLVAAAVPMRLLHRFAVLAAPRVWCAQKGLRGGDRDGMYYRELAARHARDCALRRRGVLKQGSI